MLPVLHSSVDATRWRSGVEPSPSAAPRPEPYPLTPSPNPNTSWREECARISALLVLRVSWRDLAWRGRLDLGVGVGLGLGVGVGVGVGLGVGVAVV